MIHARINGTPLSTESLHAEGEAFDLGWDGERDNVALDVSGLPSLDFSLHLINTVKFHICQLLHLFEEQIFFSTFYAFYENPIEVATRFRLWYVHYLLILAFGKAFTGQNKKRNKRSGCDLFVRAMKLLPDATYLCRDELLSAEILVCIALYLQSLDFRAAAHVYVCFSSSSSLSLHLPSDSWCGGHKLIFIVDWPSNAPCANTRTAHQHSGRGYWRESGTALSQDLVDHLHFGPKALIPNGCPEFHS